MDDTQRIVKCGNLSLHTPGGFFKKRWHSKYLVLYDGSKSGVKRLELFDSEIKFKKQSPVKIIPLVDCVRIVTCQRHKTTFTFEVRTSDQFYLLASKSFQDMNDWVNCLRFVAFGQPAQQQQQQAVGQAPGHLQAAAAASSQQLLAVAAVGQRQLLKQSGAAATGNQQAAATSNASSLCATSTASSSNSASHSPGSTSSSSAGSSSSPGLSVSASLAAAASAAQQKRARGPVDVLLAAGQPGLKPQAQPKSVSALSNGGLAAAAAPGEPSRQAPAVMTASQAAAAAASALAKTRQRQPSLLGSCKPQPPTDSPFIKQQQQQQLEVANATGGPVQRHKQAAEGGNVLVETFAGGGQIDTLTPTVRGQLIAAASTLAAAANNPVLQAPAGSVPAGSQRLPASSSTLSSANRRPQLQIQSTLDEEEENMLYCSIEDNPSEHNYRVKVIETELALRCQLKCYQLTASTTISEQYEELSHFRASNLLQTQQQQQQQQPPQMVTFYQLIIGPQELTLLNDYATALPASRLHAQANSKLVQQQGLWSWPYQCIRRYGFDKDNCFMFEAGRKCTSGPGQFIVQTPKAYNIYQDVVKFVNELRTISGGGGGGGIASSAAGPQSSLGGSLAGASQPGEGQAKQVQQQQVASVTQIPVTWTPASLSIPDAGEPSDISRRQFFDALRRIEPTSAPQQRPATTTTSNSEPLAGGAQNQLRAPGAAAQARGNFDPPDEHRRPARQTSHDFAPGQRTTPGESQKDSIGAPAKIQPDGEQAQPPPPPPPIRSDSQARAAAVAQLESRLLANRQAAAARPQHQLANGRQQQPPPQPPQHQSASISSSASEETDESGYEQGDESVDSASRSVKSTRPNWQGDAAAAAAEATETRTGPAQAGPAKTVTSAGSSSSSSSSSCGTSSGSSSSSNSPGQSISRRTGDAGSAGGQARLRPPLPEGLTKSSPPPAGQKSQLPPPIGGAKQNLSTNKPPPPPPTSIAKSLAARIENDFEASLIRDVYSEITKLHAKFAVTTNGADESGSMSSGESHTSSTGTASANDHPPNEDELDEEEEEEEEDYDSMDSEPMYTNLRLVDRGKGPAQSQQAGKPGPPVGDHQFRNVQQQQVHHTHNGMMNFDHNFRPPHYPSILNPIPEIAEHQPTSVPQQQVAAAKPSPSSLNNKNNNNNSTGKTPSQQHPDGDKNDGDKLKDGSSRARLALNREAIKRSQQPVGQQQQHSSLAANKHGQKASSKPTNHYLINDVQYAKISRNMTPVSKTTGGRALYQRR